MHPPRGRRAVRSWMLSALLALAGVAATGCGADGTAERPYQPTLPQVDFRPKLVLSVGDAGTTADTGPRADAAVRTDPPTVPSGSVVEVVNAGAGERRVRAGTSFDTGILRPGERTTVVVANATSEPADLRLVDVLTGREEGRLVVLPATPS